MPTLAELMPDIIRETAGIAVPSSFIGSSDRNVLNLITLANREGRELMRQVPWTALQRLHTFSTVADQEEYALPSDFDRILPSTEWNRTNDRPIMGPLSAVEWETIKSGVSGSGVVGDRYRISRSAGSSDRVMYIDPVPSAVESIVYWYVSKNWCEDASGTGQSQWSADTDVLLLDEDLFKLGVIIRFKRSRGLEYASEADEYSQILARTRAQDRPARILSVSPEGSGRLLGYDNLPETGLGG